MFVHGGRAVIVRAMTRIFQLCKDRVATLVRQVLAVPADGPLQQANHMVLCTISLQNAPGLALVYDMSAASQTDFEY